MFSTGAVSAAGGPAHFVTLPPRAPLPSGQACAAAIPSTPETVATNIPFNQTMPTPSQLAEFYRHPVFGENPPASDYFRVDGHYSGSTDMILRWAACKWGIDEDVARAQAWTESKWKQGGPNPGDGGGDKRVSQSQCVQGAFVALWNFGCENCCYQSWGILQTKVYYEWGTWPMIKDSTAFNADYRYADQRACMNGDYAGYFASAAQQPNTYAADIASSEIDRVLWGCIGMHYSGGWYTAHSLGYISEVRGYLLTKPWMALRGSP
jgi:autotransporter family porin